MKPVRDRIPELAAGNGHPGTYHQASLAEFALGLRAKLLEEVREAAPPARPLWPRSWATSSRFCTPWPSWPAWNRPASSAPAPARPAPTAPTPAASYGSRPPGWLPPARWRPHEPVQRHPPAGRRPARSGGPRLAASPEPGSFTVEVSTADRHGRIALTGTTGDLYELLARMAQALLDTAKAAGCQDLPARR